MDLHGTKKVAGSFYYFMALLLRVGMRAAIVLQFISDILFPCWDLCYVLFNELSFEHVAFSEAAGFEVKLIV